MLGMDPFVVLSKGLQAVGVVVAGIGLWKTWHEVPGERFFGPAIARGAAIWRRASGPVARFVRRLLRRPRNVVVTPGTAKMQLNTFRARARVQFGELPTDVDSATAIAELDQRTRRLMTFVTDVDERTTDDADAMREELAGAAERLASGLREVDERARRVIVGGVRWEASGLFLVGLGTALELFL